jgi:hypothetical protein
MATFVGAAPTFAAVSPHETINATIDGDKITLTYGRPYTKSPRSGEVRKIWGGLVPYGKVWRTGADAATTLTTEKDLVIGDTTVPAGKYTLYTFPVAEGTSKLIINKKTGQWGIPYPPDTEKEELARVDMKKETIETPVDQFTMAIESTAGGGGVIKLSWEKTQYSVAFKVK